MGHIYPNHRLSAVQPQRVRAMDFLLSFSSSSLQQGTGDSGSSAPVAGSMSSRSVRAREKGAPIGSYRGSAYALPVNLRSTTEVGRQVEDTPRSAAGSAADVDRRSTTSESTSRSGRDQGKQQRGRRGQATAHAGRWTPTSNPSNPPPQNGDITSARGGQSSMTSSIRSMASSGPQQAHASAPVNANASEPSRGVQGLEPATPSEHVNAWAGSTGYVTLQSPANSVASTFRPPNSATQGVRNRTPSQRPMSVLPLKLGSSSTKRGGEGIMPLPTSAAKAKPSNVGA